MPNRAALCGAILKDGGTCRNRVTKAGSRCHLHRSTEVKRKIFALCMSTVEKAVAVSTLYEMYEKAYPVVVPYVQSLAGLLMPEHFWLAFVQKNRAAMQAEFEKAKSQEARITEKYKLYGPADRRRVEDAYTSILAELQRLADAA